MKMPEKIHLKCGLCEHTQHYQFSEKQIQGLEILWKASDVDSLLLEDIPKINSTYIVQLNRPLTINTKDCFWGVYLNPLAFFNGIDTEQDLIDLRFCCCEIVELINLEERTVLLKVKVLEVRKMGDFENKINPEFQWAILLNKKNDFNKNCSTENYKDYSCITVSVQGDLGVTAIVKKENKQSEIVALHEWDFHLDIWSLCSMKLTQEDEKRYGIQHFK